MKNLNLLLLFFVALLFNCNNNNTDPYGQHHSSHSEDAITADTHPGKRLLETQCYVCHNPKGPEKDGRIAPPMIAIKKHYINDNTSKEEFKEALWNFLKSPSKEKAKLHGAVERFGLMPYQPYRQKDIETIGDYIYDYDIEEPSWFKAHWEKRHRHKEQQYEE
ncbi:MAG: hypothetical protein HRU50_12455 [Winogradskyella sp.]|uniref:hypothetical protein n=1 Tax=Winogradskyella sp. TaxID=1883156 RepID=UPI0025FBB834|nr:hypothetical protein [Winogradskyella sp.]NRB60735.1 hypothetical protein [Winogradskyella sp.]